MKYAIKYGAQLIHFQLSGNNQTTLIEGKKVIPECSEQEIVRLALENPVNSQPLNKIVRKGEKTCIVAPDRTRICRVSIYLPLILSQLNRSGIQDCDISIILANGTHRKNTKSEQIEILGEDIVRRIQIIEHDCHDMTELVHLGETEQNTSVYVNRQLMRAERVILTGGVLHHYFAGFGGGPKLVVPGCAGYQTILQNHKHTIHPHFHTLHPACHAGNTEDNPVHRDIRNALKFVPVDFSLNVVTNSDGIICQAFAGELFDAHAAACQAVHLLHSIPFEHKTDLVIAGSGGYPKDLNFIQMHKALHHAYNVVKKDGVIILLAQCRDGIGSKTFLEWFNDSPDIATMHRRLCENFKINGNTALALKMKTDTCKVVLVTDLDAAIVEKLGIFPAKNMAEALEIAYTALPGQFTSTIIPNASSFLPILQTRPIALEQARKDKLIAEAGSFVKQRLGADTTGHDWWHAWRVWKMAKQLADQEGGEILVIELAALFHDVIDWKNIDETDPAQKAIVKDWLMMQHLPDRMIQQICEIIDTLSFKGAGVATEMLTLEGKIVQDADRLDAMGAIGIARTFAYGGSKNQPMHLPDVSPQLHTTEAAYKKQKTTTFNHFYEKLLLLKERLSTPTAQKIGAQRHEFLEIYLERFLTEWNGADMPGAINNGEYTR